MVFACSYSCICLDVAASAVTLYQLRLLMIRIASRCGARGLCGVSRSVPRPTFIIFGTLN